MASSSTGGSGFGGTSSGGGSGYGGTPSPRRGAAGRGRSGPGSGSGGGAAAARRALEQARERKALELFHQNRLREAELEYLALIAAGSRNAEVYLNLAAICWLTQRPEETLEPLRTAIRLRPDDPEAHATLGTALQTTGDLTGAVEAYGVALRLRPGFVEAMVSLGNALVGQGNLDGALEQFNAALTLDPENVSAHITRGALLLSRGDFAEGWRSFEWRWLSPELRGTQLRTSRPRWSPGTGCRRLLVWAEQGVGDQILFASMLADARKLAEEVLVQVDPRLIPLLERSLQGLTFFDRHQHLPESFYDAQLPMGSLGRFLRPDASSFPKDRRAFLQADPERVRDLREQLGAGSGAICGISWHSFSPRATKKSILLEDLAEDLIRADPSRRLVSLQYGPVDEDLAALEHRTGIRVEAMSAIDVTNDLDQLAALISACDEVVSVSNATAHLAGALGASGTVIVKARDTIDGRWPANSERTPWYPTLRIVAHDREVNDGNTFKAPS